MVLFGKQRTSWQLFKPRLTSGAFGFCGSLPQRLKPVLMGSRCGEPEGVPLRIPTQANTGLEWTTGRLSVLEECRSYLV
jgi:hypothetical protein